MINENVKRKIKQKIQCEGGGQTPTSPNTKQQAARQHIFQQQAYFYSAAPPPIPIDLRDGPVAADFILALGGADLQGCPNYRRIQRGPRGHPPPPKRPRMAQNPHIV